jgi:hypothetical protein
VTPELVLRVTKLKLLVGLVRLVELLEDGLLELLMSDLGGMVVVLLVDLRQLRRHCGAKGKLTSSRLLDPFELFKRVHSLFQFSV